METTNRSFDLDRQLAYVVFRVTLGLNILVHGAGRIFGPGAEAFATQTSTEFAKTALPPGMVHLFLVLVPFAEMILGTLTTLGLLTRWSLTLGGLLMTVLIFGTAMRSDWTTVGLQMIYSITYYFLLLNRSDNRYSLDTLITRGT